MRLKIFSLNCWLLPPPISVRNHKRLVKIISLIKNHRPDIIALQEVWLKRYVRLIEKHLPKYTFIKSNSRIYNKSGLVTGLLRKHKSYETYTFPITKNHSLSERIARKGYHSIELNPDLYIINTHLYAPQVSKHEPIVKSQFQTLQKHSRLKNCILIGDLNLKDLNGLNTVYSPDTSKDLTASNIKPHIRILFNRCLEINRKIDYILKTKNSKIHISTRCLESPILSDHRVILGNVNLSKK